MDCGLQPISKTFFHSMSIALQFNGYRANCSSQPAEAKKCYFPEMVRLFIFFVLQHSICFSFLMQSQNGFSYLFVNAAVVPAFVHHWRDQEEEKMNFAQARSTQRRGAIILWRVGVRTWTEVVRTQVSFICFVISWFSPASRLIFNTYSDRIFHTFSAEI